MRLRDRRTWSELRSSFASELRKIHRQWHDRRGPMERAMAARVKYGSGGLDPIAWTKAHEAHAMALLESEG